MTCELSTLFEMARDHGLQLGRLCQYAYVAHGASKLDHWEAHFHTPKGVWYSGAGRTPAHALAEALKSASCGVPLATSRSQPNPANEDFSLLD